MLLIGKNGAGKTTVGRALEILQRIARGVNRVGDLVRPKEISRGRQDAPMRFEIEVELAGDIYNYELAFEYPKGFRELRVFQETLTVGGRPIYTRDNSQVRLIKTSSNVESTFRMDWHLVALPIIQRQGADDPLHLFKQWCGNMLILWPMPSLIQGTSEQDTLQPSPSMKDVGAWFSGLLATAPSAYSKIEEYLMELMPDLEQVKNPVTGNETRGLIVEFSTDQERITLPFEDLSDGEKCFMIFALVIAANHAYGPLACFWDEPDNHLTPSEVGASVMALRRAFKSRGQLIVTSHNPEAIRRFSDENTLVLYRNSHLEPTIARPLEKIRAGGGLTGDLIEALVRDDVGT